MKLKYNPSLFGAWSQYSYEIIKVKTIDNYFSTISNNRKLFVIVKDPILRIWIISHRACSTKRTLQDIKTFHTTIQSRISSDYHAINNFEIVINREREYLWFKTDVHNIYYVQQV